MGGLVSDWVLGWSTMITEGGNYKEPSCKGLGIMKMTPQEFIKPDLQGYLGVVTHDRLGEVRVNHLEIWKGAHAPA